MEQEIKHRNKVLYIIVGAIIGGLPGILWIIWDMFVAAFSYLTPSILEKSPLLSVAIVAIPITVAVIIAMMLAERK